jgi:hypothetical protein
MFNNRRGIFHPERVAFGWRWIATPYFGGACCFRIYCTRMLSGAPQDKLVLMKKTQKPWLSEELW